MKLFLLLLVVGVVIISGIYVLDYFAKKPTNLLISIVPGQTVVYPNGTTVYYFLNDSGEINSREVLHGNNS